MRSSLVESYPASEFEERGSQSQQYQPAYKPPFHPPIPTYDYLTAKSAIQRVKRPLVLAPAEGWLALLLLAIAVSAVVFSIISARWVNHTSVLWWSAALGLLIGLLIAKVQRVPQAILHLAACLVGYWFSIWLTSAIAFHISWILVLAMLRAAITGGLSATTPSGGDVVFLFYLAFLCYYLGYFGTWLTYRAHLPWLVALVYCSVLLLNLNYVRQDLSLLVLILVAALILLIARIQLVTQLTYWTSEGMLTDRPWLRKMTRHFMQWASILALLTLCISSILPIRGQPAAGVVFWNYLDNAWASITHGKLSDPISINQSDQHRANFFSDHLALSAPVGIPTGEVLYYSSTAAPQYLEGFTYDHFDGHTWISSLPSGSRRDFAAGKLLPGDTARTDYTLATTNVTIVQPPEGPHYIFAPAQPAMFDVPTSVGLNGTASDWMQQSPLTTHEHYRVVSDLTTATAHDLSTIPLPKQGQVEASWLDDRNYKTLFAYYLQTPDDLSPEVKFIAQQWTAGATNAYAAAKMLESRLNDTTQFTYSLNNPPIPDNVDAVTWLLETHRGYCTHYATAMTTMARLLGIPARIANGFGYGHFDKQRKLWVVDGSDSHSWVQIYFPSYGWINFDPTPGFSLRATPLPTQPGPTPSPVPTTHPVQPTPTKQVASAQPTHPAANNPRISIVVPGTGRIVTQSFLLELSIITLLSTLFLLLVAVSSYWWRNLYTNPKFVSGMYWRVCRIARWAGMPPQGWQTPYEYSRALSRHFPREAAPWRRLTELFVRDRWAAPHEVPYVPEEDDLERLWPHLRRVLLCLMMLRISNMLPKSKRYN